MCFENRGPSFDVLNTVFDEGVGDTPGCAGCGVRPRVVENTVGSDWDFAGQCLKNSSVFDW